MSRSGEITRPWGDRDRTFRLTVPEWEKVQEKCDAGPAEILSRLAPVFQATAAGLTLDEVIAHGFVGTWRVHDVREPLYRALMRGEKLDPTAAGKVIRELVDERPLLESVCLAYEVVLASITGAKDEPLGESKGEATSSPAESSPSPTSTEPPGS